MGWGGFGLVHPLEGGELWGGVGLGLAQPLGHLRRCRTGVP